jgi:hypothetical protein
MTHIAEPGKLSEYISINTQSGMLAYWVIELGPINTTTNQYDYTIVTDQYGITLYVYASNINQFFSLYNDDVINDLQSKGYNDLVLINQNSTICIYEHSQHHHADDDDNSESNNDSKNFIKSKLFLVIIIPSSILFCCIIVVCVCFYKPEILEGTRSTISSRAGTSDLSRRFLANPNHVQEELKFLEARNARIQSKDRY